MDQAMLSALMKSYGAADTPENSNMIRQHYAANPQAAERKAYGLQGQSDESGGGRDAILNAMIDKMGGAAYPTLDAPSTDTPLPMVQNTQVPTRKSAMAAPTGRPSPNEWAGTSENPNLGPVPARDASVGEVAAAPGASSDGMGLMDAIALLIGGGAAGAMFRNPPSVNQANGRGAGAGGAGSANRAVTGPASDMKRLTYEPKLAAPDADILKDGPLKQGEPASTESRRPINTQADERSSDVKNKPINMDTAPQQQGPYDGKPMNVQDQMLQQANRRQNGKRIATGRR